MARSPECCRSSMPTSWCSARPSARCCRRCATTPGHRRRQRRRPAARHAALLSRSARGSAFRGVHNFPTVAWFDGEFRRTLEATGLGYEHEIAMLNAARDLDLLTVGYAFNAEDTERLMDEAAARHLHLPRRHHRRRRDRRRRRGLRSRKPPRAAKRTSLSRADQARRHPACARRGDRRPRARAAHARPHGLPRRPAWLEHRAAGDRRTARGASRRRSRATRLALRTRLRLRDAARCPFRASSQTARRGRYAVGYFESWSLELLLAVADAAEAERSPVILGFSGIYLPHPARQAARSARAYAAMASGRLPTISPFPPACSSTNAPHAGLGRSGDRARASAWRCSVTMRSTTAAQSQ